MHDRRVNISNIVQNSLWLCTGFIVGGLIHIGGEYMVIGRMGGGAFKFFVLQSAAIILEKVVISGWAHFNPSLDIDVSRSKKDERSRRGSEAKSEPPILLRCVGYAWVILWFVWSFAFMIDPMVSSGMFIDGFWVLVRNLLETF